MKSLICLVFVTSLFIVVSCNKVSSFSERREAQLGPSRVSSRIESNSSFKEYISNLLLQGTSGKFLKKVIAIDQTTGSEYLGFVVLSTELSPSEILVPAWGSYTGWVLYSGCCWMHGTFYWSGTTDNAVFLVDVNSYGDNYIGNEPRCMDESQCDYLA